MLENMTTLERIDAALHLLNQIADSKGRERCAQICVVGDILESVKKDFMGMIKSEDLQVGIEVIPDEEVPAEE